MRKLQIFILLCSALIIFQPSTAQNAIDLDGTNDYIDLGDNYGFDTNDPWTVEARVRIAPSLSNSQVISKLDAGPVGWGIQIMRSNFGLPGTVLVYLANPWPNTMAARYGDTNIRDNEWHHLAVTYDGSGDMAGIRIFLDGVEEVYHPSIDNLAGSITNGANCLIGAWDNGGATDDFLEAGIDDVRIWNNVRTPGQIGSFWNQGYEYCSGTAGLIGLYKFNQGTANGDNTGIRPSVRDDSWTPVHGDLMNMSLMGNASNFIGPQPAIPCAFAIAKRADVLLPEGVKVFPNPSQGEFTLELPESEVITIRIYDAMGKLILEKNDIQTRLHTFNMMSAPAGVYYLHIEQPTGKSVQKINLIR